MMPQTIWWVLLAMMTVALALHLMARDQRRRAGRAATGHETAAIIVTIASMLLMVSQLLGVDTTLARLLMGFSMALVATSVYFSAKAFRRRP